MTSLSRREVPLNVWSRFEVRLNLPRTVVEKDRIFPVKVIRPILFMSLFCYCLCLVLIVGQNVGGKIEYVIKSNGDGCVAIDSSYNPFILKYSNLIYLLYQIEFLFFFHAVDDLDRVTINDWTRNSFKEHPNSQIRSQNWSFIQVENLNPTKR